MDQLRGVFDCANGVLMESKPFWESRTLWVNLLTTGISVLGLVAGSDLIAEYPRAVAAIAALIGVANIVLRFLTTVPVSVKPEL